MRCRQTTTCACSDMGSRPTVVVMSSERPLDAIAVATTLMLAAACWVVVIRQPQGMDMGVATELGSFSSFIGYWVPMMTAMMLPGATPAISRLARVQSMPLFVGSYLSV